MTRDVWPRTSGTDLPTRVIPGFVEPRSSGTESVITRVSGCWWFCYPAIWTPSRLSSAWIFRAP